MIEATWPTHQALIAVGVTLAVTVVLARLLPWVVWKLSGRLHGSVRTLLRLLTGALTGIIGVSVALQSVGAPILAAFGVGVAGGALALATGQVSQGLVSGAWLLAEGDFDVGDTIDAMGYTGTITEIALRRCIMTTVDPVTGVPKRVTLPNAGLLNGGFARHVTASPVNTGVTDLRLARASSLVSALVGLMQNVRRMGR